jgi:putative SOS response-associated peptidase YedK
VRGVCGRYTQTHSLKELAKRFTFLQPDQPDFELLPRYNVAPAQDAPIVFSEESESERKLAMMRWGLIPRWSRDASIAFKTINARSETLEQKPAFKDAYKKRRCLVLADGFYEWRSEGKKRLPVFIALEKRAPFAMAGLWEAWKDPSGREVRSFTIVTVPANEALRPLHERMPAILRREDEALWLDARSDAFALADALRPLDSAALSLAPASTLVNAVANEGPDLLDPEKAPARTSRDRLDPPDDASGQLTLL